MELNEVIRETIPYRHGRFRFRVYKSSEGRLNFMIADSNWFTRFDRKFKKIAFKHGWLLKSDRAKGLYYMRRKKELSNGSIANISKAKTIVN